MDDPITVRATLRPFLEGDLRSWNGLPALSMVALGAALGEPGKGERTNLGWYPADRYTYAVDSPTGGINAYARDRVVILIETIVAPPLSAMNGLGEPSAILPNEILAPDAYVHEYLYCEKGLVLSIAEPFEKQRPKKIVRCRGIKPLNSPDEFGPEFYLAFENRTAW